MVEQLKLSDTEFEKKNKFHCFKQAINISRYQKSTAIRDFRYSKNKETNVRYHIRYKTGKKVEPLLITLPQRIEYFNKVEKNSVHVFFNKRWKIVGKI